MNNMNIIPCPLHLATSSYPHHTLHHLFKGTLERIFLHAGSPLAISCRYVHIYSIHWIQNFPHT